MDDPLAELARIVSGRTDDEPAPAEPRRAPAPVTEPAPESDILGDLEAELLSDLQASFSAVKESVERAGADAPLPVPPPPTRSTAPAPTPAAAPITSAAPTPSATPPPSPLAAPPAPVEEGLAPQPSVEQTQAAQLSDILADVLGHPVPPAPVAPAARQWPPPPLETSSRSAPALPSAAATYAPAAADPSRPDPVQPDPVPPEQPPAPAVRPQSSRAAEPAAESPAAARRALFGSKRVDISSLPLRRLSSAATPPPAASPGADAPVRAEVEAPAGEPLANDPNPLAETTSTRWDAPASGSSSSDASRFAPPRAARPPPLPVQPPAVEPALTEPGIGGAFEQPQSAPSDAPHMTAFPSSLGGPAPEPDVSPDEYGAVPGYDDEGLLPPFESENLDGLIGPKRPRIGLIAIAAALVAVVAGGAAIYFTRSPQTGEPPIIAANTTPTKEIPAQPAAGDRDGQGKLIYDRVDSTDQNLDSILLKPGNSPLADTRGDIVDNPIARVILPDRGQGSDGLDALIDGGADLAAEAARIVESESPKRVRTVVVRPDGTIVSNQSTQADQLGDRPANPTTELAAPAALAPAVGQNDTLAIAGPDTVGPGNEIAITPLPDTFAEPVVSAPVSPASGPSTAPLDLTPPLPRLAEPPPVQVASAPAPVTAPVQVAAAPTGTLVQVSSQRSVEAARATFRDLQARYPRILGGLDITIQRADLGARGIFFRVKLGPFSPADAQRLCADLKAAGGDCILTRT